MKRSVTDFVLVIGAAERRGMPMYRQLYDRFRSAIVEGRIRPGERIPSTRALAVDLGISRPLVLCCKEQLLSEGYLETFVGAGTCVAQSIPDELLKPFPFAARRANRGTAQSAGPRHMSRRATAWAQAPAQSWLDNLGAFRVSLPALDHFPLDTWSKLVARHARTPARGIMAYGDPMGHLPFREALAHYLRASRGVKFDSSQDFDHDRSQQAALQLCAALLLDFQ